MRHLKYEKHRAIEQKENGIYYISDELFPIQLIITKQLPEETNLWLHSLTNDLDGEVSANRLVQEYGKHQAEALYQSVMDIIVHANEERFQVKHMCAALEEIIKDRIEEREKLAESRGMERGIEQGIERGIKRGIEQGIEQGIERGIKRGIERGEQQKILTQIKKKIGKGKSVAQIADELEETEETILPLYNRLKAE